MLPTSAAVSNLATKSPVQQSGQRFLAHTSSSLFRGYSGVRGLLSEDIVTYHPLGF
jgi:hypothetical protein